MPAQEHPNESELPASKLSNPERTVRSALPADSEAMLSVVRATGLFPPEEFHEVETLFDDFFSNQLGQDHFLLTAIAGKDVAGVAYYAPERMTRGTWNLYMIAVHPDRQGEGHGRALVRSVEDALSQQGERMLIIETAGLPSFEPTRSFYRSCGYEEEARIRNFYDNGTDKVIFCKLLREIG